MLQLGGGGSNLYDLFSPLVHFFRDFLPLVQPPRLLMHRKGIRTALVAEEKNIKEYARQHEVKISLEF